MPVTRDELSSCLTFSTLLGYLQSVMVQIPDPRKPSNATTYMLADIIMSGFAVFFTQCGSFLEYQRQVQQQQGKDNAQGLFGIQKIASDNQIRNILDWVGAQVFFPVFVSVYLLLQRGGYLEDYQVLEGNILLAIDGVEYFRSEKIHCSCCSHRQHRDGRISYFHQALLPVIVAPDNPHVISLPPEFITPQDGHDKQDCEIAAAKRWLKVNHDWLGATSITLLGDDLYSHQPLCEDCLSQGFNFIFVCLPDSHTTLYEWVDFLSASGKSEHYEHRYWDEKSKQWHHYSYRYVNEVPLRDGEDALWVNWFEVTVTRHRDGKQLYFNTFVTKHHLQDCLMPQISLAARTRWKTENENHNTLKTKGYALEHNFGHGQRHLSQVLLTLNVLAFLFHTVLHLIDRTYQQVRQHLGPRQRFFEHLRTLTYYMVFDSWQQLLEFMGGQSSSRKQKANTS